MRDLIEARLWDDHGHQFSEDLHRLFVGVSATMQRLAAIQFEAPWRNAEPSPPAEQKLPRLRLAGLALGAALTTVAATLTLSGAASAGALVI